LFVSLKKGPRIFKQSAQFFKSKKPPTRLFHIVKSDQD